jgi:AraC-like DNA-binding protein
MKQRPIPSGLLEERVQDIAARREADQYLLAAPTAARRPPMLVSTSANRHIARSHEFFLVRTGQAVIATPRRRFRLRPGELLLVEPGVEHEEIPVRPSDSYELSCFVIDGCRASLWDVTYVSHQEPYLQHGSEFAGSENLGAAVALLAEELSRRHEQWEQAVQLLLDFLATALLRRLHNGSVTYQTDLYRRDPRAWPQVEAVGMFCRANLGQRLSRASVATLFGYSPRHLSRLLKEHVGQAYSHHLRMLRMEAAMALLADSAIPVAEVGATVGYPDPANFSRAFRRQVGVSPSAYRRANGDHQ